MLAELVNLRPILLLSGRGEELDETFLERAWHGSSGIWIHRWIVLTDKLHIEILKTLFEQKLIWIRQHPERKRCHAYHLQWRPPFQQKWKLTNQRESRDIFHHHCASNDKRCYSILLSLPALPPPTFDREEGRDGCISPGRMGAGVGGGRREQTRHLLTPHPPGLPPNLHHRKGRCWDLSWVRGWHIKLDRFSFFFFTIFLKL